ncbi:MAG: DUF971 domain-containing protein [Xanthomonadales bacterium]|jgi:DUF971 family protein|nr:DUF971 domain-containing protein [Xanthomonadales bacterium]
MPGSAPTPTLIRLHQQSRVLEVGFADGSSFQLPCEYLRVNSPSAEVQGHGPDQRVTVPGKRQVNISAIHPVGNYAVMLVFDDGHQTGIYSWETLYSLGREQAARWAEYLAELESKGLSRDFPSA